MGGLLGFGHGRFVFSGWGVRPVPHAYVCVTPPLDHGLRDAIDSKRAIETWAGNYGVAPLIVAASIAHQAGDIVDRPFGSDAAERGLLLVRPNASIGIAQIRPSELKYYAPDLVGNEEALFDPVVAARIMSAKLAYADSLLQDPKYKGISTTDRYMLLAIVQNSDNPGGMPKVFDAFIANGMNWGRTLRNEEGWTGQVRSVALHMQWLLGNGYELPAGLDMDYWLRNAFSDIEGVDYE